MSIKIGNLDISYFKVGGADCSIYIGDVKMYPTTPSSPKYVLTLSDSTTVSAECDGTSAITQAEISAYTSTTVAAEIGDCVTEIGNSAFYNCTGLTSVTIPNSVTSIGYSAFRQCSNLTSIEIPSGVTSIGSNVFRNCTGLTSVDIPNSVTTIDNYAFNNCSSLASCTIGSGVTYIGESAFNGCSSLTSISIPDSVTTIGRMAFNDCSSLTSIDIPSGVTILGNSTFRYCSSLTSVTIPDSVTKIANTVFNGCSGLISVTIEVVTPPTLGSIVFDNTNNCPIYVPCESVDTYKAASGWRTYASRITCIPTPTGSTCYEVISDPITAYTATTYDSVYSFADLKWYMKNNLNAYEEYGVYDVVEDISSATTYEGKLAAVETTEYQYSGGSWAVVGTYEDSSITYEITSEDQYEYQGVELSTTFKIPTADIEALGGWLEMSIKTQNSGHLEIGINQYNLDSEQGTVTSDSDYYYYSLPNTQSIIIEKTSYWNPTPIHIIAGSKQATVEYQEKDAPTAKEYSTVVDMEADTCPSIGIGQFGVVGNNVYQFNDNEEWDTFNNVRFIGRYSGGTTNVLECDSSSAVTSVDTKPAYISAEITSAEIGECVTEIGSFAFNDCSNLTSVTIPNSVTGISTTAFNGCSGLTSIDIPNSVTSIGTTAFGGCSSLLSCTIGSGVTSIGFAAFGWCTSLSSITINATNPPTLGNAVFDGSTGTIYVPSASVNTYKSTAGWSKYASRIQAIPNS